MRAHAPGSKSNAPWDELQNVKNLRHAGQPIPESQWVALAKRWQKIKYDAGWACLVWPRAHGGAGLGPRENVIFQEEEAPFCELFGPFMIGQGFIAPTLMAYARPEQQAELLPMLASGGEIWCQLFSEPSAGSDLAGVRTRAEPTDDGRWRINGQKVWTSGAHYSDWGLAVAAHGSEPAEAQRPYGVHAAHGHTGYRDSADPAAGRRQ